MAEKKGTPARSRKSASLFSEEERAAMKEAVRERIVRSGKSKLTGEEEVLAKIAQMEGSDRAIAERIHALVKAIAPTLAPRTWYGMPAYSKDDDVLCWFTPAAKFKARYASLSFGDGAKLDEGRVWPISFAMTELNPAEEARIAALVKKAVG